jgi:Rod binding domain-containing protein
MDSSLSLKDPLSALPPVGTVDPTEKKATNEASARKVAQDFESYFLSQFVDRMFQGIPKDSLSGDGHGEEIFRSMLTQEYGKALASRGAGIADQVYREILKTQEVH